MKRRGQASPSRSGSVALFDRGQRPAKSNKLLKFSRYRIRLQGWLARHSMFNGLASEEGREKLLGLLRDSDPEGHVTTTRSAQPRAHTTQVEETDHRLASSA